MAGMGIDELGIPARVDGIFAVASHLLMHIHAGATLQRRDILFPPALPAKQAHSIHHNAINITEKPAAG